MKRGFILTEKEKNRIKGLYNLILEQDNFTIEGDPDEIGKFQTWLDGKYPEGWAYSNRTKTKYTVDGQDNKGYKRYGPNTQRFWNTDAIRNEYLKSINKETPKSDVEDEPVKDEEKKTAQVNMSALNSTKKTDGVTTTNDNLDTSTLSTSKGEEPSRSAFGNFDEKTKEGFKKWYDEKYNDNVDLANIEIKKNSAVVTIGNQKYTFQYDNTTSRWLTGYERKEVNMKNLKQDQSGDKNDNPDEEPAPPPPSAEKKSESNIGNEKKLDSNLGGVDLSKFKNLSGVATQK